MNSNLCINMLKVFFNCVDTKSATARDFLVGKSPHQQEHNPFFARTEGVANQALTHKLQPHPREPIPAFLPHLYRTLVYGSSGCRRFDSLSREKDSRKVQASSRAFRGIA